MPYVGRDPRRGNYLKLDDIQSSFNGSTKTFNLTSGGTAYYPDSTLSVLVSVGGTVLEPATDYGITNNQITFTNAPESSYNFFAIVQSLAVNIGVPGDGVVTGEKLAKPLWYDDYFKLDSNNNRVGIGIENPIRLLHLHESNGNEATIHFSTSPTGTTASDGFRVGMNASEEAIVWNNESGIIKFGTNNEERFKISADGSQCTITSDAHDGGLELLAGNNNQESRFKIQGKAANGTQHNWIIGASRSADRFYVSNTTATHFAILDDGKTGIGIANPVTKLQIHGGDETLLISGDTAVGSAANTGGTIALGGIYHNDGSITGWSQIKGLKDNNTSNNFNGYLSFTTRDTTDGYVERLRIKSDGTVIAGATDVSGGNRSQYSILAAVSNNTSATGHGVFTIQAGANSSSGNEVAQLCFSDPQGDYAWIQAFADAATGSTDKPGRLVFSTTADGAAIPTERLRIASDGEILVPAAGANRLSMRHTSGGNFVIKNPTAATLSFGTNDNDNELTIANGGNVGIGTDAPDVLLHAESDGSTGITFEGSSSNTNPISGDAGTYLILKNKSATDGNFSNILGTDAGGQATSQISFISESQSNNAGELVFGTRVASGSMAERLRIDSSGRLITGGNVTPYPTRTATFQPVSGQTNTYVSIIGGSTSSVSGITFGDAAGSDAGNYAGMLEYYHADDRLTYSQNASAKVTIDSTGNVGIGKTNPDTNTNLYIKDTTVNQIKLETTNNTSYGLFKFITSSGDGIKDKYMIAYNDNHSAQADQLSFKNQTGDITFLAGGTSTSAERLRIDSVGRILIGHSASLSEGCLLQVARSNDNTVEFFGFSANSNGARINLTKSRGAVGGNTIVHDDDTIGELHFRAANGSGYYRTAAIEAEIDGAPSATSLPGRLIFSTTPAGALTQTERLRITSAGLVQIDTPGVNSGTNGVNAKLQVDSSSQYDGLLLGNAATYGTISRGASNGALVYTANASPANLGGGEKITHEWWSGTAGGGGPNQLMVLSASGNLGIGTDVPTSPLSFNAKRSVQTVPPICFQTAYGTGLADAAISTTDDSGGTDIMMGSNVYMGQNGAFVRYYSSYGSAAVRCQYTGNTIFYNKSGNNAPEESMRITGDGKVAIGGNAQALRLTVRGADSIDSGANEGTISNAIAMFYGGSRNTIVADKEIIDTTILHIKGQILDTDDTNNSTTGTHATGKIVFSGRRATGAQSIIESATVWDRAAQTAGSDLKFYTAPISSNGGDAAVERLKISNSGYMQMKNSAGSTFALLRNAAVADSSSLLGSIDFGSIDWDSSCASIKSYQDGAKDKGSLRFYTQASVGAGVKERLRIRSNGDVILGPYDAPAAYTNTANNVPYQIKVAPYGWANGSELAAISMGNHSGATGNDDGEIVFKTAQNVHSVANALQEKMRITGVGDVGIGNDAPGCKLAIRDVAEHTAYAKVTPNSTDSMLQVWNNPPNETALDHATIQFGVNGGTHNRVASISAVAESASNRTMALNFCTDSGANRSEKMSITSAGEIQSATGGFVSYIKSDINASFDTSGWSQNGWETVINSNALGDSASTYLINFHWSHGGFGSPWIVRGNFLWTPTGANHTGAVGASFVPVQCGHSFHGPSRTFQFQGVAAGNVRAGIQARTLNWDPSNGSSQGVLYVRATRIADDWT